MYFDICYIICYPKVCSHIVQAIKKEAKRARDEWEADLLNGAALQAATPATPEEGHQTLPDTYCFEMLSMVLALSGSPVGRAHLAHQESLLKHLLSLLHTGSARVQRQVWISNSHYPTLTYNVFIFYFLWHSGLDVSLPRGRVFHPLRSGLGFIFLGTRIKTRQRTRSGDWLTNSRL